MFPLNLQRNIVQLDRQISLLENECKNMEVEKKKKGLKPVPSFSSCSKNSNARMKAPTVKVTLKKTESSKKSKRPTPPASSRLQSTGSLPSHCSRTWCENDEPTAGRKGKPCAVNSKTPIYTPQTLGSPQCNSRSPNKCTKCVCYVNEMCMSDVGNDDTFDVTKRDHVLLFPNSGGTIEVTVTQKTSNGKENSPISYITPIRKSVNSGKDVEKDLDGCRCQIKGRKWSDILCSDPKKKRQSSDGICVKNQIHSDKAINEPLNFQNNRKSEDNALYATYINSGRTVQEETFEVPVKLPSQLSKPKRQSEINSDKFEKEIQCSLENSGESTSELKDPLKDPVKIFQVLLNQVQQLSGKDLTKSPDTDISTKAEDILKSDPVKNNSTNSTPAQNNESNLSTVKHHCENLIKEKSSLTEELTAKDNIISTMKKREEEYLSLIASLKTSLEKAKEQAQEGSEAVKQMSVIKNKLLEQMKVSEALKKKLIKLQEDSTEFNVENSTLKTEIKILRLEAQKHAIMMAGKEAEINRYREEIQNFQRQIEEHLASLKSNAQVVDIEKMIEAIMQQSQIFAQTDLDSVIEKDDKDSSRLQNVLMHSSPTSTKTSVVNSSWKQISSIHEHDQSKALSEVIYLNEDEKKKNFFDIFGDNSEAEFPRKTKEPSIEKLLEKREVKNSSSFTSCTSLRGEDHNTTKSTSRDSLLSKDTLVSLGEEQMKNGGGVAQDKAQSNIDELLKNMKLKFSKEIFETTLPSCTTGDYLDISQISSISPL